MAYVANGLVAGEAVVVAATPAHHELLEERLAAIGIDAAAAHASGQYLPLDADALHGHLPRQHHIDPERFESIIGEAVERVAATGSATASSARSSTSTGAATTATWPSSSRRAGTTCAGGSRSRCCAPTSWPRVRAPAPSATATTRSSPPEPEHGNGAARPGLRPVPGLRGRLRELLPPRRGSVRRPRVLDQVHRPPSPGPPADGVALVHLVRRGRHRADGGQDDRRGPTHRPRLLDPDRRRASRTRQRARGHRGRRGRRLGPDASPAPSSSRTSPAPGCTPHHCRGPSRSACIPRPGSAARSCWATGSWRSTAGRAWSATTGAASTPSAGSGCTAPASTATRTRGSTWCWRGSGPDVDDAVVRVRWALPRRRAAPARRTRPGSIHPGRRASRRTWPSHSRASDLQVHGRVAAPASRFVGWVYADPDGGAHDVVHCSIADLELTVEATGRTRSGPARAGSGGVRAGHAGARPRHRDPALPGRLTREPRCPDRHPPGRRSGLTLLNDAQQNGVRTIWCTRPRNRASRAIRGVQS